MRKGLFISVEGPDGSGKSTQTQYIREYFAGKSTEVVFTREPGGTKIGEKIRNIILDNENREMCDMTEALLYAASRAQHVKQVIIPALEDGKIVICDRFIDSSIAYQGFGRQLGDSVRIINEFAVDGCMPDVTFLMDLDPKIGKSRIAADCQDRLEQEKMEFHNRVYAGYKKLTEMYSERYIEIDASKDEETIKHRIYGFLDEILKNRKF